MHRCTMSSLLPVGECEELSQGGSHPIFLGEKQPPWSTLLQPYTQGGGDRDFTMRREPLGIMLQPLKTISCVLIVGWAMSTVSSHEDVRVPLLNGNRELSHLPREQLVKNLQPFRQKRDAECPPDQTITDEVLQDKLMPIYYAPEDLQLCLKGPKLVESLPTISSYAFTYDQLKALKDNLDKEFPDGYPSWLLPNIGVFLTATNETDIKKWNYTSPETLAALLSVSPEDDMAKLLIKQYLDSGGQLNSTALDVIGPKYICLLDKDQFSMIDENAIKMASNFDPSKCSQAMLDNLYPKAKRAFSDRHNEFPAYYNLIKPYLGGAPGEDLRALSKNRVNMDIGTFMTLRKDSVMDLTVDEVKGLLGRNLRELKDHQDQPVISAWIHRQKQSDLDSLDLGLKGGLPNGYMVLPRISYRKKREAFAFGRI
ncbi:mesothelin-like isoform X2 [Sceloporus undulatus]|uniref:mesothelin-like isoform X2 n=1 Tax=Sceloporus undulatus TaxID=8520 RepID=UPI001C4D6C6A|nr:mesothelin-like isoform X2 [Sceloporus undulatus]